MDRQMKQGRLSRPLMRSRPHKGDGGRRRNTRPGRVSLAYTTDGVWRNRSEFIRGREEIRLFLQRKWARELDYRLIKEVWAFHENRIAVRFAYEWHDDSGNWFRSYGNENWEFSQTGLMQRRIASINDLSIGDAQRKYHWPLGRRPDNHPGLSELVCKSSAPPQKIFYIYSSLSCVSVLGVIVPIGSSSRSSPPRSCEPGRPDFSSSSSMSLTPCVTR